MFRLVCLGTYKIRERALHSGSAHASDDKKSYRRDKVNQVTTGKGLHFHLKKETLRIEESKVTDLQTKALYIKHKEVTWYLNNKKKI